MEERYRVKSTNGMVMIVYDDHITLTQEGAMGFIARGLAGSKDLYYSDMSSIQFKNCGWTAGFIEFTFPGSNDHKGGAVSGVRNENRFTFGRPTIGAAKQLAAEMEEVNAFIQDRWRESKQLVASPVATVAPSAADEIIKFKQLLDNGVITQEEFDAKKKQLLGL